MTGRRVKTGCRNCRDKHKKCDEVKPVCGLCTKRQEPCRWPPSRTVVTNDSFRIVKIRADDGDNNIVDLRRYSSRLLETLDDEEKEQDAQSTPASILDASKNTSPRLQNLINLVQEEGPPTTVIQPMDPNNEEDDSLSPDSLMAPFLNYNHLHRTFRDYMFTNVATSNQEEVTDAQYKNILESPAPEFFNHKNTSKSLQDILNDQDFMTILNDTNFSVQSPSDITFSDADRLYLFKIYLYEVAPWLDMFDTSHKQFGTTVPYLAKTSQVLANSILAIASRQLEQTRSDYNPDKTIKLYKDTLKTLIPTVNKTLDTSVITSCVILCVFEMMSLSPKKWRYHLEGCAALFKSHGINGFCSELERGLFWCYARMDVNSAVIGEEGTIIPSEQWLPPKCSIYDLKDVFNKFGNPEDMYSNYMVYLCSRVLNLIARTNNNYEKEWRFLWNEICDWHINRPIQLQPLSTFPGSPFPAVIYVNGPSISANQLFHMSIILLTQNKPRHHKIVYLEYVKSPIWHAKQIVAITLHNEHHGCWNNALQPLWIAGQLLSSEHEHQIVLDLLSKIESTTGWQMNFRAKDLKNHWYGAANS